MSGAKKKNELKQRDGTVRIRTSNKKPNPASGRLKTKEHQIREILKCGKDPIYFINRYVKIQHPQRGLIPFKTYDFQDDIIRSLQNNRFNIIVKSRQLGISTTSAAYALWLAMFYRDKNIVCIATKLDTAVEFMDKVRHAFANIPSWLVLKPKIGDSRQHIKFANGSQIRAIPRSDSAGRGLAASFIIIDEAAHIDNFEKIWTSLLPSISAGGSVVLLSSPNGANGLFYKTYVDAVAKKNDFVPHELKWYVHPERDKEWEIQTRKMYSKKYFAQEYDCDFLGSGDTYIESDTITWLKEISKPPIRRDGPSGQLWIWEDPNVTHSYVISADVARGDGGGDYSTFHVFDVNSARVVAEFMGHIRPDAFGKLLDRWGRHYNNALVCPELNTYGHHTVTVLMHRDYPNMYYEKQEKDPNFFPGPDDIPGYTNSGKKKRNELLANMEAALRNHIIEIYSSRFIHQLQNFVWHPGKTAESDGKAAARKGEHDDLIMSFAIGLKVLNVGDIDETAKEMAYALLNATGCSSTDFVISSRSDLATSQAFNDALRDVSIEKFKDENVNKQPIDPEVANEIAPNMPEHIRRRVGDLRWLYM